MITKQGRGAPALSYAEALDIALAWGWIDSQKRAHDDRAWLQRFTPRRPRSAWSKINREKAEALLRAGAMQPPGLREVERAKQDGRWDAAYDSARTAQVPDDLAWALARNRAAAAFFETLGGANRYAILDEGKRYVYPDVSVVCGPIVLQDGTNDVVANPSILIEVLSSTTEPYDRGLKWEGYQRLASLTDYLLVAQREVRVEHYQRAPGRGWFYRTYGPGERIALGNGAQLEVDAIYARAFELPGD
jgi:hypothetical protein